MSDERTNSNTGGLAGVIQQGILNYAKDLHTAFPARIISFNAAKQTAEVQPQIQRLFKAEGQEEARSLPKIINAPVWQPRAGGFAVTFPIKPGDDCLVVISERSLDNWFINGVEQQPNDKRLHHLSDAIVLVGMAPAPRALGSYDSSRMQMRNEAGDQAVSLAANGDIEIVSPTKITLTAPEVDINASTQHTITSPLVFMSADLDIANGISYGGNATGIGTSTAADHISGVVSGNSHVHGGVQSGGSNTGGPV